MTTDEKILATLSTISHKIKEMDQKIENYSREKTKRGTWVSASVMKQEFQMHHQQLEKLVDAKKVAKTYVYDENPEAIVRYLFEDMEKIYWENSTVFDGLNGKTARLALEALLDDNQKAYPLVCGIFYKAADKTFTAFDNRTGKTMVKTFPIIKQAKQWLEDRTTS